MSDLVAPTTLKNALTKCHIDDWLTHHGKKNGYKQNIRRGKKRRRQTESNGIMFENHIYKSLDSMYEVVKIADGPDDLNYINYRKTVKAINDGAEIIYQGVLIDYRLGFHGIADFLIRSDLLVDMFKDYTYPYPTESADENMYHYVVADSKFSKLQLCADGKHIGNTDRTRYYKTQVWMYNLVLSGILGYQPSIGLIIGNGYSFTKKRCRKSSPDWLDRPGVIDFNDKDQFVQDNLVNALQWYKSVSANSASSWQLVPVPEKDCLWVNPKLGSSKWSNAKKLIAEKQDDIAMLWNCTEKNRKFANDNGIIHAKDVSTGADVGFKKGSRKDKTLTRIIKTNRTGKTCFTYPKDQLPSGNCWYIDFETISQGSIEINGDIITTRNYIYLIGMTNSNGEYHSFSMDSFTHESEAQMLTKWLAFIKADSDDISSLTLVHWGYAEKLWLEHLIKHHSDLKCSTQLQSVKHNATWFDVCGFFTRHSIVFPGQKNFSLKSVVSAMSALGHIKSSYTDLVCSSGDQSVELVEEILDDEITQIKNHVHFDKIVDYNKIDCLVLFEIMNYLKTHDIDSDSKGCQSLMEK